LERDSIRSILDLNLTKLLSKIEELGFKIKFSDAAKEFLADKGFDPDLGARPLSRTIQKFVEDPIAEELLKMEMNEGDTIEIDYDKEANPGELKISSGGKKASKKKKEL